MATVYERICEYEKISWFRFNYRGRLNIGAEVAKAWRLRDLWRDQHSTITQSIEIDGSFQVPNYPECFTATIDEIIYYYVVKITTHEKYKKKKKINEKPVAQSLSKTTASVPSDPPKRLRTRKPVPAYTTRKK